MNHLLSLNCANFFNDLEKFHDPHCGRPLGVAFDTISDRLIVSDSYFGIYEVNLRSFSKRRLISPEDIIDGPVSILLNSRMYRFFLIFNLRSQEEQSYSIQLLLQKMAIFIGQTHLQISHYLNGLMKD